MSCTMSHLDVFPWLEVYVRASLNSIRDNMCHHVMAPSLRLLAVQAGEGGIQREGSGEEARGLGVAGVTVCKDRGAVDVDISVSHRLIHLFIICIG